MEASSAKNPAPFFCAAPWLESVLYNDGSYRICSRNSRVFGDWRKESLTDLWAGEGLKEFRRQVKGGHYPDHDCRACHQAGTAQSLGRVLTTPLENTLRFLVQSYLILFEDYLDLQKIEELFTGSLGQAETKKRILHFEEKIKFLLFRFRLEGHAEHLPKLKKLQKILAIVKAYHEGEEAPPVVGPFRQVQLIAKCNARCVMCPGKFSGEIVTGGSITPEELEQAMDASADIIDFFCNGSEFLLFKEWREVALKLKASGIASLRLSSNGMLLTEEAANFLLEHDLIGHLNLSLNAGTKETLERVQKNVRWDRLIQNVENLLRKAEEGKIFFPISFSFIVMRSNFHELPDFLRLVARWKRSCRTLQPHVMIMSLENAGEKDYRHFLYEEHPAFAPRDRLKQAFEESLRIAEEEGIASVLYNFGSYSTLAEFVKGGCPAPEFFHHESADKENLEKAVRFGLEPFFQAELSEGREKIRGHFESAFKRNAVFPIGTEMAAMEEAIALAVGRLSQVNLEKIPDQVFSPFRWLLEKFPAYRKFLESYFVSWRGELCVRLGKELGQEGWQIFREFVGFDREALGDHHSEKYLQVPGQVSLDKLSPGSRVLGKDYQVWRLPSKVSGRFQLVRGKEDSAERAAIEAGAEFVLGAFLFDLHPGSEE